MMQLVQGLWARLRRAQGRRQAQRTRAMEKDLRARGLSRREAKQALAGRQRAAAALPDVAALLGLGALGYGLAAISKAVALVLAGLALLALAARLAWLERQPRR